MRIGIDAHALGTGVGGNETFVRQLLLGLRETQPDADIVAYVNREVASAPNTAAGFTTHPLATRSSWLRVPFALPWAVRKSGADLLHVQYIAPPICPCPFVVTLHDMVWKQFPETLTAVDRHRLAALVPGTLRRAARVFCVTEAMKRETTEYYGVSPDRIDVVYNSADPRYQPTGEEGEADRIGSKYGLPEHYVAYLGALQPRKNVVRLATAFARLKDRGLPHKLVLIGKKRWLYGPMEEQIAALNLGDRLMFTGYVDDDDLPVLLRAADAFAYISLYEGFGLPVIEAMACGTPVLASTDPALQEVSGGHAVHCDPLDTDAIADGLERILTDDALRARLRTAGPERAAFFTHANMARAAMAGYEKAMA